MIAFIRRRNLRTTSNYFTMGLMFSSFLVAAYAYPMQVLIDLFYFTKQPACYLVGSLIIYAAIQMVLFLLLLTIERYITIIRPLVANTMFTAKRAIFLMACIPIYSFCVSVGIGALTWIEKGDLWQQTRRCNIIFMIPSSKAVLFVTSHHIILIPIMFVIYSHIFITVRRHIRSISKTQPATSCEVAQTSGEASSLHNDTKRLFPVNQPTSLLQRRSNGGIMQEAKSALRLFLVLTIYIINWVPVLVFLLTGVVSEKNISPYVYVLIHTFTYSSGVFSPLIYGLGNKVIRKEVKAMILPRSIRRLTDDTGNTVYFVDTRRCE
ncbi:Octopamine receptor beta-2R [Holothuria leucospilota]|uniref:Octopamine receptor beta-2R n=1 Tax=Holothuria leucospilota TaxID=206669 RepID=A0A9Q1HC24_HOLLE|nr:Octopamine receptor beta-2R [Holothuria leucospilota]